METKKKRKKTRILEIVLPSILAIMAFFVGIWMGTEVLYNVKTEDQKQEIQTEKGREETSSVSSEKEEQQIQEETQVKEESQMQEVEDNETVNVKKAKAYEVVGEDIVVQTPYGVIYYPAQFEEFLRISHEFSNEDYAVHYNIDLGTGEEMNLYSVYFTKDDGRQPDGTIIGGVTDEEIGLLLVITTVNQELPHADWDDDTKNLIYAMQEGLSYSMEQLSRLEGLQFDQ